MSSVKTDNFTYFFPIWRPFTSFSCLIALARISSTMLNKSSDDKHPHFFPDLNWKASSHSVLTMMLDVGFLKIPFIKLRKLPSIPSLLSVFLNHK